MGEEKYTEVCAIDESRGDSFRITAAYVWQKPLITMKFEHYYGASEFYLTPEQAKELGETLLQAAESV